MANKIMVLGASGFIGTQLVETLKDEALILVSRNPKKLKHPQHTCISWDQLNADPKILKSCSHIVSLCGQSILGLWTKSYQNKLVTSRTTPLLTIERLLKEVDHTANIIVASGIGYYGYQDELKSKLPKRLDETSPPQHHNELSDIALRVEQALSSPKVCYLRLGLVIDRNGGIIARLKIPHLLYLGTIWGTGHQPVSWISLDDATRAIQHIIKHNSTGIYNLCSPNSMTHAAFMRSISAQLNRRCWIRIPTPIASLGGAMVRCTLLTGAHVYPKRLLNENFEFNQSHFENCLQACE